MATNAGEERNDSEGLLGRSVVVLAEYPIDATVGEKFGACCMTWVVQECLVANQWVGDKIRFNSMLDVYLRLHCLAEVMTFI